MTGARRHGVTQEVATEIFSQIESFAGYAFCKAHSASFALESFASAYWKAHSPAEFMAAVLTNQGGYYTPMEYAEEARRCRVRLLPPCVNESRQEYWGREDTIRVGLMQVKGLQKATIDAILTARREGGPFTCLQDFLCRVPMQDSERRTLVRCGALDACGASRPRLLWELELRLRAGESSDPERLQTLVDRIPPVQDWDRSMRMRAELETLELTLDAHPFALFREVLQWVRERREIVRSVDLRRHAEREVYLLGWKVTAKRTTTVNGESMCFVTFSDEQGRFEASFFPEVYERYARELVRGLGPFLVRGKVERQFGVAEVVASHVLLLRERPVERQEQHSRSESRSGPGNIP
jgi:error-prone DNA polymerase